jgi:ketosteroid isomerase-like protein
MPRSDTEVVQAAFDALAERGVEGMLEFVHEQFEMATPPELASEPDTYRGHDGVRRWFDSFYEAVDELRLEPVRVESCGGEVAAAVRMVARGRTTGLETVQNAAVLGTVADEKVKALRFFATWDEALEAADAAE